MILVRSSLGNCNDLEKFLFAAGAVRYLEMMIGIREARG